MLTAVLLALSNGLCIGLSRAVNGHLGRRDGPLRASLWNHVVGFVFLSAPMALQGVGAFHVGPAPWFAWIGGVLGVAFVALNSHVVVRLGASRTAGLVVGAQMLTGVVISNLGAAIDGRTLVRLAGAGLIVAGIWLANTPNAPRRLRRAPAAQAGEPK
ncbi:DMT family transporter [Caulobacter soli]|uniref:DMT family transporter n=1 Tax=Caulobacter soli TaxID=2708539 RepID=UPI0013EBB0BE|nr:DMT family transporter [Caulobacter soli]